MLGNHVNNSNDNIQTNNQDVRRQSILASSNPNSDSLPIDCILVYDRTDHDKDSDDGQQHKKPKTPSERRRKFEDYLCKQQGLIVKRIVSRMNI